jgi:hypothetical protein
LSTSDKARELARESKSPVKKAKRKEQRIPARVVIDDEEILIDDDDDDNDGDEDDEEDDVQEVTSNAAKKSTNGGETALASSSSSLNVSKYFKQSKYFQSGSLDEISKRAAAMAATAATTTTMLTRPWEPKPIISRSQPVSAQSLGALTFQSRPSVNPESFAKFRTAMGALRIIVDRAKPSSSSPMSKSSSATVTTSSRLMLPVPSATKIESKTSASLLISPIDSMTQESSTVESPLVSTPPVPSSGTLPAPTQVPGLSESIHKAVSSFISALADPSKSSTSNAQSLSLNVTEETQQIQLVDDRIWREALVDVLKFVDYPIKFLFQLANSSEHVILGRKLLTLLQALPFKTWDAYEMKVGIPSRPGVSTLCATLDSIAEREPLAAAFATKLRSLRVTATTTKTYI